MRYNHGQWAYYHESDAYDHLYVITNTTLNVLQASNFYNITAIIFSRDAGGADV